MDANDIVQKPLQLSDKFLKLIQDNFNVNDSGTISSYDDIVQSLELLSNSVANNNKNSTLKSGLNNLIATKKSISILEENKFRQEVSKVADSITSGDKVSVTASIIDDFIYDVKKMQDWLEKYHDVVKRMFDKSPYMLESLIALGQLILTEAVALCPIETGNLRKSGTLLVGKDYIIIYFSAPYATYVHENLNAMHITGRAKFLEVTLQRYFPDRSVWVELHGESIVWCKISLDYKVEFRHYL